MADTVKQIGIRQLDGTFLNKDIGVDSANVEGLSELLANKQNTLTQGENIVIEGNTISAIDTTYENKSAAAGSDEVSLVTRNEKAVWNAKVNPATTLSGYNIQNAYTKTEVDNLIDGASKSIFYSKNLMAGQTSVTFNNLPNDKDYVASFFASNGASYQSINTSIANQITVYYDIQSTNITVYLKLEEIIL